MAVRPQTSTIWQFFDLNKPVEGRASCKACGKHFKYNGGTTSNLWSHYRLHDAAAGSCRDRDRPSCSQSLLTSSADKKVKKPGISRYFAPSSIPSGKSAQLHSLLANWIVRDLRPCSIVEDGGLRDFVKALSPGYRMPSHTHVTELVKRRYDQCKEKVTTCLSTQTGLALTTDIWTSRATDGYISLSALFVTPEWVMGAVCMGTVEFNDSHTGVNIADKVRGLVKNYAISDKTVVALVHDQASNMEVAGRELESSLPAFSSVVCAPHRLQNSIKAGLEVAAVQKMLACARKVVGHFKHSVLATTALKKCQKEAGMKKLKVIQDVCTRWNSTFYMLQRLLLLREPIDKVLQSTGYDQLRLKDSQYSLAKDLVAVLQPYEVAMTLLSAEKSVTVSCVLPVVVGLLRKTRPNDDDTIIMNDVKSAISKDLAKRFGIKPFKADLAAMTTLLDPRYLKLSFMSMAGKETLISAFRDALKKLPGGADNKVAENGTGVAEPEPKRARVAVSQSALTPSSSKKPDCKSQLELLCAWNESDDSDHEDLPAERNAQQELDEYLAQRPPPMSVDPLGWWKSNAHRFPLLASLARMWLCVPASSAPTERVFSTSGGVTSQQRNSLAPANVDKIVFLHKNWEMLEVNISTTTVKAEKAETASPDVQPKGSSSSESSDDGDCPPLPELQTVDLLAT